ncbi:BTAD domain-containing putative transcriptional regulator [Streptomyces sp. NPDC059578]|uniref:BTAD domain-containing putative transcriptional regulator n=1 Tax=Streptomyces sp. NPDC059578 TaxID=3346874 RepID=UPI0036B392E7
MRFGVLGPLAVWTVDGDALAVPGTKVRALLADLLVHPGRAVSADRLVDDLWGDGDGLPARPASALQTLVSRLRSALTAAGGHDLVVRRPPGYLLKVSGEAADAIDAERFAALADRARRTTDPRERAARFTEALALWRGPAFAGSADRPFARAAAARLEEQRLLVWEEYAESRLHLGEHAQLAAQIAELMVRHPLRERLRASHMRALHGAGRPGEALDVYRDLRLRLAEELGLEPGPALVTLQREILRQGPAAPPTAPAADPTGPPDTGRRSCLPVPVTALIGRSGAAADVRALLATERLVTLTGPGGVGKTRLALEVANGAADSFPDGVHWVELSGLARTTGTPEPPAPGTTPAPGTADGPAQAVAVTLGIRDDARPGPRPSTGPGPLAERLAAALHGRRLLLVLDNCEHVVDAVAHLVRTLLRTAPGLRFLTTSREPLDLSGETLWPVPPLDVPPPGATPSEVRRSSAVRLFAARAAAASPGFTLSDDHTEAVATICRRMDGIPLALELASTRVRVLGPAALAGRLDDRFGILTAGRRDAPARQQTLRAVIDWSWDLLTAAERAVLRRLAIHSDGCALEAAEALCSGGGVKPAEVVDLLARLVDRSLVVVTHRPEGPRYRLLESVSAYCLDRLRTTPGEGPTTEYEQLRRAHAHHYTDLAERADPHLCGSAQQPWLRRLDTEAANLRAALDTAATTGDAPLARRLVRALAWYWFLRGRFTEARRSMATALAVEEAPPATSPDGSPGPDPRATVAAWHVAMTLLCGDRPAAGSLLRLPEDIRDPRERAAPTWFVGYAVTLLGAMETGEELVRRALDDFRALNDRWGIAAALSVRGVHHYVRGELAASRADGEQSLALFRESGDQWGQLQSGAVLSRLDEIAGDYRAAELRHRDGLRIAEELDLWTETSTRWSELGRIALLTGDHARAAELHERGRRVAVDHGDRRAQEFAETGLALGARRQGRYDEAERHLRTWLEWNRRLDAENGTALILAELGFIAEQRGEAEAALTLHTRGLTAARRTGDPRAVALALEGLAGAHRLAGRPARAASLLGTAARARAAVGAPLPPAERGDVDRIEAATRTALGDTAFTTAYARTADPDLSVPADPA